MGKQYKSRVLLHLLKGHLSKETFVQGTVVQVNIGPRSLLSKEAFTGISLLKLFFYFLLNITILFEDKLGLSCAKLRKA